MERVRDHERKDHEIRNQRKVREKRPGKTPGKKRPGNTSSMEIAAKHGWVQICRKEPVGMTVE